MHADARFLASPDAAPRPFDRRAEPPTIDARWVLGRMLIHLGPVFAAGLTLSYAALMEVFVPTGPWPSAVIVGVVNAVLGAIVSGCGVIVLSGRSGIRVAGALAYAVLSLFVYAATVGLIVWLVSR